jgi:hypothetical protein
MMIVSATKSEQKEPRSEVRLFVKVAKHMTVEGGLDGEHGMQW